MSRLLRTLLLGTLCLVGWGADFLSSTQAWGQHPAHMPVCRPREYGTPDLFYNFWVPPNCGGMGAEAYICPRPVPPLVGHTYYTYQPFMPHELMYRHSRVYHRNYEGGRGLTRTSIHWW